MLPPKVAKALARLLIVVLFLFGVSTFLRNPLAGENGYFAANATHGILYIVVALVLFAFTTKTESTAAPGLYTVSVVFLVLAIAGYLQLDSRPYGNVTLFGVMLYSHSDLRPGCGTDRNTLPQRAAEHVLAASAAGLASLTKQIHDVANLVIQFVQLA